MIWLWVLNHKGTSMLGSAPEGAVCYYSCKKKINLVLTPTAAPQQVGYFIHKYQTSLSVSLWLAWFFCCWFVCFFYKSGSTENIWPRMGRIITKQLLPAHKKCPFTATSVSNWSFQHSLCTPSLKIGPTCSALYIIITCFVPFDGSSEPTASVKWQIAAEETQSRLPPLALWFFYSCWFLLHRS